MVWILFWYYGISEYSHCNFKLFLVSDNHKIDKLQCFRVNETWEYIYMLPNVSHSSVLVVNLTLFMTLVVLFGQRSSYHCQVCVHLSACFFSAYLQTLSPWGWGTFLIPCAQKTPSRQKAQRCSVSICWKQTIKTISSTAFTIFFSLLKTLSHLRVLPCWNESYTPRDQLQIWSWWLF